MWANTNVETLPTFLDGPVAGPVNCWYGTKGKVHPQKWLFSHPSGASVQVESKTFQELHSKNSATAFIETPGAARKWKTHLHDVSPYSSSGLIYRLCFEKRGRIKNSDDDVRKWDKSSVPPDEHTVDLWSKHFLSVVFIIAIHFVHIALLVFCSAALLNSVVLCVVSGTEDALIPDTSCQSVQTETYLHFRPPPLDPICHPDFLKINLDTVWIWHTTDLGLQSERG